MFKASVKWQEIIAEYPTDLHAIKQVHGSFFYMGRQEMLRDSVNGALPAWTPHMPHYR